MDRQDFNGLAFRDRVHDLDAYTCLPRRFQKNPPTRIPLMKTGKKQREKPRTLQPESKNGAIHKKNGTKTNPVAPAPANDANINRRALHCADLHLGIITGQVLDALRSLPSDTFNLVVTSPPYFWVRDYDIDGQIGHENTVDEYVKTLGEVFEQVRRVLHPRGVFYLNIADTYYSGNGQPHGSDPRSPSRNFMRRKFRPVDQSGWSIPKKSLIGIPWKVAFHLQAQGWTLRSDIIWRRDNSFSEPSARDRPSRQYEHLFLFSKSRFYSYSVEPIKGEGDVWNIPIERSKLIDHNAPFPKRLVERCILTGSPIGGKILDPFVGSGTTLISALEHGRHGIGIDLKPEYTDGIVNALTSRHCVATEWTQLAAALETTTAIEDQWNEPKDLP